MTSPAHSASTNPEWPPDVHILGRTGKLAALVVTLDDGTFDTISPIPTINPLTVLLRHVAGFACYWLERVCLGRGYVRDRDGGFSVHYSVTEGLETYYRDHTTIESALVGLQGVDYAATPAVIPTDKGHWWCSSTEGVIVRAFHEAAQYPGYAEITRNALAAGLRGDGPDDGAGSLFLHPLDTVIDVLAQAGHVLNFIEHTADSKTHIITVDGKTVIV